MDLLDVMINLIEAMLYSFLAGLFIDISRRNRFFFHLLFVLTVFLETTISNYITIYDGLYSLISAFIMFTMMFLFQDKEHAMPVENLIIYVLMLGMIISIAQEIDIMTFFLFTGVMPIEITQSNLLIPAFLESRIIVLIVTYTLIKYTKKYNYIHSPYTKPFVIIFLILNTIITLIEGKLYQESPDVMFLCGLNIMMFSMVLFSYVMFCKVSYDAFRSQEETLLSFQLKDIENMTLTYSSKEKELRTIKHNLINQFTVLRGYLDHGDINSGKQFIENTISQLDHVPIYINSGYTAIDTILSTKFALAKSKDIQTFSFLQIADLTHDEEYNIAIILGNLLDNAIENIGSEERIIKVKIICSDHIMIRVENRTDRKEIPSVTTKKDLVNHGLGLDSVKNIALMYDGELLTDLKDNYFVAVVIMR